MDVGKKYENIQALRAIAILFVVLNHLTIIEVKFGKMPAVLPEFLSRGMGGIDLFFTISGLMMVTISRGKYQSTRQAFSFLYNRLVRIYPLYWIYSLLVLPIFFLRPDWVNSAQGNRVDLLSSFLLLPSDLLPLINVAWMLVHLCYFYSIFFLVLWLCKERYLPLIMALWVLLVGAGQVYFHFHPSLSPLINLLIHPYTFEFITGCFIGFLFHTRQRRWGLAFLTGGLILYFIALFQLNFNMPQGSVVGWHRVLLFGPPAALILYGVIVLEWEGRLSFPAVFNRLGDASYSLYLSHIPVLVVAGRIWALFSGPGWFQHWLAAIIMLGVAILFGQWSYRFLEAPMINKLRTRGSRHLKTSDNAYYQLTNTPLSKSSR
jgi:exopolysaccharide production protein ExoZ